MSIVASLGTIFYLAGVFVIYPHLEAWALHLGCLIVLVGAWRIALHPRRHFTVRGLLGLPVAMALVFLGLTDVERATRELNAEGRRIAMDRLGGDQIDEWCRAANLGDPGAQSALVEVVRNHSAGWGRAVYVLLVATSGEESAAGLLAAIRRTWISRGDRWDHTLGCDCLGLARAHFEREGECTAMAEEGRTRVLKTVLPTDDPAAAAGR